MTKRPKQIMYSAAAGFVFVATAAMCGCKSATVPVTTKPVNKPASTYPPRPSVAPPTFKVFHQSKDSITLVTAPNATDDQIAATLWQLRDAAHAHTFDALHIPQKVVDARDPMIWFHLYRGPQCAAEKYAAGKLPCGPSYHAAGDFTLGGFTDHGRDTGMLLHDEDHQVALWNPDAPAPASVK